MLSMIKKPSGGKIIFKNLGSGWFGSYGQRSYSFSVTDIPGYEKLTVDNFLYDVSDFLGRGNNGNPQNGHVTKSYNKNTGVITYSVAISGGDSASLCGGNLTFKCVYS